MDYYAGIDVSLEKSSVCVVDVDGKIVREAKVLSEPEALIAWFGGLGVGLAADRTGGGSVVAMALRGDEKRGLGGGVAGDAACARRLQGDAGQNRPQGCPRDCAIDAARLVPSGSLQIDVGSGGSRFADGAQIGPVQASRYRDEPARDIARLWPEGRGDKANPVRLPVEELVAGHPTLETVAKALLAAHEVLLRELKGFEKRVRTMARDDKRVRLLMSTPGVGRRGGADLCRGD